MARYAMVHEETGEVLNVMDWDGDEDMPDEFPVILVLDADGQAQVGFLYRGGKFSPPGD